MLTESITLAIIVPTFLALVVQFVPLVFFKRTHNLLYAGPILGCLVGIYTLLTPFLVKHHIVNTAILEQGLFNLLWLRPEYLLNISVSDSYTRSVILSLLINLLGIAVAYICLLVKAPPKQNKAKKIVSTEQTLQETNTYLQEQLLERTQALEEVNSRLSKELNQRADIEQALRDAKKMADEANASKTKFLALASHDIMQPLNAANLYASALQDSGAEDNTSTRQDQSIVKQLKSAIQNTESIIATLLEVSKLDSGAIEPKISDFDLHSMLQSIFDEVSVQKPKDLSIRYCKTSVLVRSDRNYLHRIVQNFVSNAVKYTLHGKVLLGCRRVRDEQGLPSVEICVFDNGIGISENERACIFDDFYRVPPQEREYSSEEVVPGVGLGLSVVSRFSELLGHKVRCRSQLHKGSCFSVVVPLCDSQVKREPIEQQSWEQNTLQGIVVAYVDDEEQNLLATSTLLDRWQCEVIALDTITAARDYADLCATGMDRVPDVLLMDYQLDKPDITGLELAREIIDSWQAKDSNSPEVPVCIVSAATEIDLPERVRKLGFQFLRKPVKPGRLRALLTQLKERRDLQR